MANYKIKDLQQAQTLNGAVALEIQDGDSMSTFATLDQIAEFLGNTTPVVLLTKAGPIDDSYLPDMSASEIAAAYDRIVADPIHTVPVVRIPDNGGQYLVPSGYGVHADTKAVVGYYASQTYVLPSSLTLTSETFTLSRLPYTASSMEWADLLNNTALPSGYLGIDSDSTSEEISAAVGGVDAFRKLCSKLLRRNCIVVVSTDPAAANRSASIPVIVDVNRSIGLPLKITLEIEYISSGKYIALTITESGGTFSATRTSVSVSDIPDALAGKADLAPATGFVKLSQLPDPLAQIASSTYGVEWDVTDPSPQCRRIGNLDLHRSLPVQSRMRGCLLSDDGKVVEYLPAADWRGAMRDGSRGQVMSEIPDFYYRFETEGTLRRVWLSEQAIPGYRFHRRVYCSAYEATVQRSRKALCSVVNMDADYRGGNNNETYDGTYRTLLGRPATAISRTDFRNYARRRKTGSTEWNCMTYDIHKMLYWLFVIEYATLNSQAAFNAAKDSNGYAQGGLGDGATSLDYSKWNAFNGAYPFIPCGYTDEFGNGSGELEYSMPAEYDETIKKVKVSRYRGIENPFGHVWQYTDGINICVSPTEENGGDGLSKVFVCTDPSKFSDSSYDGYVHVGNEARTEACVKEVIFGEGGEIMPSVVGGSSSTYFCDYHYTGIPTTETLRSVLFGGYAYGSATAGFACANSAILPSSTSSRFGSRLCFIPHFGLDPSTGYIKSSQIAPLEGRQTGVKTGNGGFVSTDPALCLSTAKTLVVTFKCDGTPNSFLYFDHGGSNANLGVSIFIASNRLFCNIGPKTLVSFNPESGKLYQVVVSFDKNGTSAGYMNSVKDRETTDYSTITDPTHFCLGALSDGSGSFSGVILGARLFNYALTASEVATLWNGGEPERYMLPLSGEMRTGLVAEYIAAGLLADKWRDTSGAGLDLPYVPTATGGTAELSYQSVPNQGEIVIDSGIFFTDIAEGTANKRIDVPRGYVALAVAVYNYNASALTNVIVQNWTDERAFIYGATVYNARAVYSVSAAGNKSVYNGTGITIDPTVQYLKVMATGNTTSGGMRVRVICKYLGV